MKRRTLRPRLIDNKKRLQVVHEATGIDLGDATVARSIANRNTELERNNDKVVTVASKSGEEFVPVPGFKNLLCYEQLYPSDFKQKDDMNAEYLSSGKNLLPGEECCVEYAADSEDEEFLDTVFNTDGQSRLSANVFEKLIWKLEISNSMITHHMLRNQGASTNERKAKVSNSSAGYLTKEAAVKLLRKHEGVTADVIESVYEYWMKKRRQRKEPLLRTFQAKTAYNDRDPDHTFREREKVKRPNTRRRRHINRGDNVEDKLNCIKDEMAFASNIFQSLINRESIKAHLANAYIAQKRLLLDRLSSEESVDPSRISEIWKEQREREKYLGKDDAEYRAKICRFLLQNVFYGDLKQMLASARGNEGESGCEAAISRRLRKAQKRRQRVISFLVKDRNWQKWDDKTWMQKMYVILKKRAVTGQMTRFFNQKNTWRKWERLIREMRDKKLKKRKGIPSKTSKPKPGSEIKTEATLKSESPKKKLGVKTGPAAGTEFKGEEVTEEAVNESLVSWAKQQGVVRPKQPAVSKVITIPSSFVVPQNGFSCLPPRLKEMYLEAEKDLSHPPDQVSRKIKSLKSRRERINQLMADGELDRCHAVIEYNKEAESKSKSEKQKQARKKLKERLVKETEKEFQDKVRSTCEALLDSGQNKVNPSTEPQLVLSDLDDLNCETYAAYRRSVLKFLKLKLSHVKSARATDQNQLEKWLSLFLKLKAVSVPDINLLKSIISECKGSPSKEDTVLASSVAESEDLSDLPNHRKRKRGRGRPRKVPKQKPQGRHRAESCNGKTRSLKKRVKLVKRSSRSLVLELRLGGLQKAIDLSSGKRVDLRPFEEGQLVSSRLERFFQQDFSDEMEIDEGQSTEWTRGDSPVARVPVTLLPDIKAPPLVAKDESCQSIKFAINMKASRRLMRSKGSSMSALKIRQYMRRQILRPLLLRGASKVKMPRTKQLKIKALSKVKMEVPCKPVRAPIFSQVFKLARSDKPDKTPSSMKLPPDIPVEVVNSGVVRIGRGNRVWLDRVNPASMKKPDFGRKRNYSAVDKLLTTLDRVIKADRRKEEVIKSHSMLRDLARKKLEEKKAEKLNKIQEAATRFLDRQSRFLPYSTQETQKKQRTLDESSKEKSLDAELDLLKEAERLHGAASEMGLELPVDYLYQSLLLEQTNEVAKKEVEVTTPVRSEQVTVSSSPVVLPRPP